MTGFDQRSRELSRAVADAAAWMRKREEENHWWRWQVLTKRNPDSSRRPIFEDRTAQQVFEELRTRELLYEISQDVDGSGLSAYVMRYDRKGWDAAISDGRPIRGFWLKFKRNWPVLVLGMALGFLGTVLEDRALGLVNRGIDALVGHQGVEVGIQTPEERGGGRLDQEKEDGSGESKEPPNPATAPDG